MIRIVAVVAAAIALVACEERDTFGAPCASDRDCNEASYCVAGCGDNQGRCVPYGNDTEKARYRPVECCAGTLFYTGAVSDAYKAKLQEIVGNPKVRDAAKGFPPSLVNDVAADRPEQCLVCDGKMHVANLGVGCGPPDALVVQKPPSDAATNAGADGGVADQGGADGGAPAKATTTTPTTTPTTTTTADAGTAP